MDEEGVKVWRARFDRLWKAVLLPVAGLLLINGCYHINTGRWESDRAFGGWCVFWAFVLVFSPLLVKWGAMLAKWVWTGEKPPIDPSNRENKIIKAVKEEFRKAEGYNEQVKKIPPPPKMTEEQKRRFWAIVSTVIFVGVVLLAVIIVVGDMAIREKLKENAARRAVEAEENSISKKIERILKRPIPPKGDDSILELIEIAEIKESIEWKTSVTDTEKQAINDRRNEIIKTPEQKFREDVWEIVKSPIPIDKASQEKEWSKMIMIMVSPKLESPTMHAERKAVVDRLDKLDRLVNAYKYKRP